MDIFTHLSTEGEKNTTDMYRDITIYRDNVTYGGNINITYDDIIVYSDKIKYNDNTTHGENTTQNINITYNDNITNGDSTAYIDNITYSDVFSSFYSPQYATTVDIYHDNTLHTNTRSWNGHETKQLVFRILTAMLCLHFPLIIITNMVVMVTFTYAANLRTPDNVILIGLAVTDVISGFVGIPIIVINNFDYTYFRRTRELCYLRFAPLALATGFNLSTLMLLTVDRYLALSRPFWYLKNFTNKTVIKAMSASLVFYILYITFWAMVFCYDYGNEDVLARCTYKGTTPVWFNTYATLIIFTSQLFISSCCTVYVAMTLWKKMKQIRKTEGFLMTKEALERKTANAKITIFLMFVYIGLLLPSAALFIHDSLDYATEQLIYVIVDHFRYANCSANAVIYALSRQIYRKAYIYILTHWPNKWSDYIANISRNYSFEFYNGLAIRNRELFVASLNHSTG